jgi:hypothetical protein
MTDGLHGTKSKKETDMKKLLALIILSIAMVSCYENYIYDFTYTSIYFPYQMDVRTVVVGEGMKIDVGAALGGVRHNEKDRVVSFTLDNTLITPALLTKMQAASQPYIKNATIPVTTLQQLPSNYYTITNPGTMIIKKGQHEGGVTIKPDSVTFLNDSLKTIYGTYVLPFRITKADADSLITLRQTNTVAVKFENMLFGNYWHGGAAKVGKVATPAVDSATITYRWATNDIATKIWTLTTAGPSTLYTNGYFNLQTAKNELKLVLKGTTVYLSAAPGSTNVYTQNGECTFNNAKLLQNRKVFLNYTFKSGKYTYRCTDTIYFRNRIRDGVNEWQDENPDHYTK